MCVFVCGMDTSYVSTNDTSDSTSATTINIFKKIKIVTEVYYFIGLLSI